MTEPEEQKAQDPRFISCSECKTVLRGQQRYFALNERPVCGKCRIPYAKTIEASEGKGAFLRAAIQGGIIAVVGAALLAAVVAVFPAGKIFLVIPIGYLIGKRIMTSIANYSNRDYQKLAVGLTYVSFLAGMSIGAVKGDAANAERKEEVRTKMQGTAATQSDAIDEEMKSIRAADSIEAVQSGETFAPDDGEVEEDTATVFTGDAQLDSAIVRDRENARRAAAAPADEPITPGPGLLFFMFLLSPLFGMIGSGMAFSAAGVAAVGYAFFQAWKQTDGQGRDLRLSGPFRIGEGPIAATSPPAI
jgi:hypothetical protein